MKIIELTQGKVTLVDDDVYEWASKFKWYAIKGGNTFYAARMSSSKLGKRILIFLHREIVKPGVGLEVDHWDHDGLNNLRENILAKTHRQNMLNKKLQINKTSQFRGVYHRPERQRWTARISTDGLTIHLGNFVEENAAARAYDVAARKYFGEYAQPNFP